MPLNIISYGAIRSPKMSNGRSSVGERRRLHIALFFGSLCMYVTLWHSALQPAYLLRLSKRQHATLSAEENPYRQYPAKPPVQDLYKDHNSVLDFADSSFERRNYLNALLLYHEAQHVARKRGNVEDLYHSLHRLSQCHLTLNNTKEAIKYAQGAFHVRPRAAPFLHVAQFLEGRDADDISVKDFYYAACHAAHRHWEPEIFEELHVVDKSRLWPWRFPEEYLAELASLQTEIDDPRASKETHEQVHWEMIARTRAVLDCGEELFRREGRFQINGDFYYATPSLVPRQWEDGSDSSDSSDSGDSGGMNHAKEGHDAQYLIMTRLINYRIDHEGRWYTDYLPAGQGSSTLRSAAALFLNATDEGAILRVVDDHYEKSQSRFWGIEDPKLFQINDGTICVIWTTWEYAKYAGEGSRLAMGILDINARMIRLEYVFPSPFDRLCEKNWALFQKPRSDDLYLVYEWHPLRIGILDKEMGTISFNITRRTPRSFEHLRGSSNGVIYKNDVWLIVHGTTWHSGPAPTYYHRMVVLDSTSFEVRRFTYPFKLESTEAPVEFSLGLHIDHQDRATIAYSVYDGSAVLRRISMWKLEALMVPGV